MKDPIHRYFQIGTTHWVAFLPTWYDSPESLQLIAQGDSFDAIELSQIEDNALRKAIKEVLEQSHLKVCYGAQPRLLEPKLNPNATAEGEHVPAEQTLLEALSETECLSAKDIAFSAEKWEEVTKDQAYFQLIKITRGMCRRTTEKGMIAELEAFDSDMDKVVPVGPAPYAAKFASDVCTYCNNFGLMVDLSRFPTIYRASKFVIQTLRSYITHLHMGDTVIKKGFNAYGGPHPRFGYPDNANDTEQLLGFFTALKEEGFFDVKSPLALSSEVPLCPYEDTHIILASAKRVVNRVWALLED